MHDIYYMNCVITALISKFKLNSEATPAANDRTTQLTCTDIKINTIVCLLSHALSLL